MRIAAEGRLGKAGCFGDGQRSISQPASRLAPAQEHEEADSAVQERGGGKRGANPQALLLPTGAAAVASAPGANREDPRMS